MSVQRYALLTQYWWGDANGNETPRSKWTWFGKGTSSQPHSNTSPLSSASHLFYWSFLKSVFLYIYICKYQKWMIKSLQCVVNYNLCPLAQPSITRVSKSLPSQPAGLKCKSYFLLFGDGMTMIQPRHHDWLFKVLIQREQVALQFMVKPLEDWLCLFIPHSLVFFSSESKQWQL